ncbi:MAG: hypothetical protein ACREQ7_14915 [Candidatus Binatia bacterium]
MTEGFQHYKNYPISGSAIPCTATGHGGWDCSRHDLRAGDVASIKA